MNVFVALVLFLAGGPIHLYYFPFVPNDRPEPRTGISGATCEQAVEVGATWVYRWDPVLPDCSNGIEAVPMIWGPGQLQYAHLMPPGEYLLVGNECDSAGQCNLTPQEMATFWYVVQTRFPGRKLVGSNVSQIGGVAYQLAWAQAYEAIYNERPHIEAFAMHCYGTLEMCQPIIEDMIALAAEWTISGDVWLTEFAVLRYMVPDDTQRLAESARYLAWVDTHPCIERSAWFMADMTSDPEHVYPPEIWDTGLLAEGALTPLGEMFYDYNRGD